MKSDFLESNLENAGFWGHSSAHCGLCRGPRGKCSSCVVPKLSPEQLSHQTSARHQRPPINSPGAPGSFLSLLWPETQTQTTPALFQKRKNSDPVHLNISLLQEVLSVQSLQLAPSVYLRVLLKIVLMLICIIQMPYNSCLMMTSVVLYVKSETSK